MNDNTTSSDDMIDDPEQAELLDEIALSGQMFSPERPATPECKMWATSLNLRINDLMIYLGKAEPSFYYELAYGEDAAQLFFGRDRVDLEFMCEMLNLNVSAVQAGVAKKCGFSVAQLREVAASGKPPVTQHVERPRRAGKTASRSRHLFRRGAWA